MSELNKKIKIILITISIAALSATGALFLSSSKNFDANESTIINPEDNQDVSENNSDETKQMEDSSIEATEENKKDSSLEIEEPTTVYPIHKNITTTTFWIGEKASQNNKEISNKSSAWDDKWWTHYGGTDDPDKRNGFYPAKFIPNENPFYFALPYNDFDVNAKRRESSKNVPWFGEKKWEDEESMVKNKWIKIIHDKNVCYGQWEDVGPFKENDFEYVFGNNTPKSTTNKNAGLDVSPALRDCLGLKDLDKVNWQFVDFKDIPDGPWKKIITSSNIYWK